LAVLAFCGFTSLFCLPAASAQSRQNRPPALLPAPQAPAVSAPDELQTRLRAVESAKQAGNPDSVAPANRLLLATAFRKLANVRIAQTAFPQAESLSRLSLTYEDAAETHVGIAVSALYANRPDDSLAEASKALAIDPQSARAWNIQGKAFMKKRYYRNAVASLQRSVEIRPEFESAYALGVSLLSLKDPDSKKKAADVFATITSAVGDSGNLHVLFGRAYRDAEMQDDAIRELRRAVALDTTTPHAHYFLGLALLWKNEWTDTPEILREFHAELHNYPKDFLANYFLGYLYSNDRRYEQALPLLESAIAIDPTWPEPWLFLGLNAYAQGELAASEKALRRSIELTGKDDSRGNYQVRRAYITLGRILAASGRSAEAASYLEKARDFQKQSLAEAQQIVAGKASDERSASTAAVVALLNSREDQPASFSAPGDPWAPLDPSILDRSGIGQETRKAAADEEASLRSIIAGAYSDIATSEAIRRNYSAALGDFQLAEHWSPPLPGLQRNLGVAAFRSQNYQESVRALSAALSESPSDTAVRAMLGSAYFALEDFPLASSTIAPLGDRAAADPALGYAWAFSLSRVGDVNRATEVLQKYERLDLPTESVLLVGQLWTDMADYSRAVQSCQRALQADPSLARAHYFAGLAQLHWNHLSEAVDEFSATLKLAPADPDASIGLGYVYLQQDHQPEAMALFRSVIAAHPENGNAHYQLGKLLLNSGKTPEAVEHLELASRALPDSDYVHYQLQAAYRKESRVADADRELQIYKDLKARNRDRNILRPSERP
jgi:tetratricopeptide (TPR) repeat protein